MNNIQSDYWTREDGRKIHIKSMYIQDIEKELNRLKNQEITEFSKIWIDKFEAELVAREYAYRISEFFRD